MSGTTAAAGRRRSRRWGWSGSLRTAWATSPTVREGSACRRRRPEGDDGDRPDTRPRPRPRLRRLAGGAVRLRRRGLPPRVARGGRGGGPGALLGRGVGAVAVPRAAARRLRGDADPRRGGPGPV